MAKKKTMNTFSCTAPDMSTNTMTSLRKCQILLAQEPPICTPVWKAIMPQSIPIRYIPPGNPQQTFFERANPSHPGIFFLSNSTAMGPKMMVEFTGDGAKFFPKSKKLLLKLAKYP